MVPISNDRYLQVLELLRQLCHVLVELVNSAFTAMICLRKRLRVSLILAIKFLRPSTRLINAVTIFSAASLLLVIFSTFTTGLLIQSFIFLFCVTGIFTSPHLFSLVAPFLLLLRVLCFRHLLLLLLLRCRALLYRRLLLHH